MTLAEASFVTRNTGSLRALKASHQFVVLRPRNTENAGHSLAAKRRGGRLCARHFALNAFPTGIAAELGSAPRLGLLRAGRRHGRRRAGHAQYTPKASRRFRFGSTRLHPFLRLGTHVPLLPFETRWRRDGRHSGPTLAIGRAPTLPSPRETPH